MYLDMSDSDLFISVSDEDIVSETPIKRKIKTKKSKKNTAAKQTFRHSSVNRNNIYKECTKSINENTSLYLKQPYIFHKLEDILNFKQFQLPVNNNLRTVGIYKECKNNKHCLTELTIQSCQHCLQLDLNSKVSFIEINTTIEVYGHIKFEKNCSKPIFVVHFFKLRQGDMGSYVEHMTQMKEYVPEEFFKLCKYDSRHNSTNLNNDFDDIDESLLNRNVDYIENICSELDQLLQISEDIFM